MKINGHNVFDINSKQIKREKQYQQVNLSNTSKDSFEVSNKEKKKTSFKEKTKNFFNKFKTGLIAILSAGVAVFTTILVTSKQRYELEEEISKTENELEKSKNEGKKLSEELSTEKEKTNSLTTELNELESKIKILGICDNEEELNKIINQKLKELSSKELDYDATKSIHNESNESNWTDKYKKHYKLPEKPIKTTNRSTMKEIQFPKFESGKEYNLTIPESMEMKVSHEKGDFTPHGLEKTTISEAYADSLNWDNNKISRDLLQNFFDGHKQTLDGVKINIQPKENGSYTVRIEGKSTFTADKAILLGESSKKNDNKAAGCFGEGLKMVVLKLLKEKGADKVNIGSSDWKVSYQLTENNFNNKRVLAYDLNKVEEFDGNYIEFDVNDEEFLKTLTGSLNRFYHSNNLAFKNPDFENETIGIKLLDKNENGKIFIAGQEFELNGRYDNLKGAHIFIKEKPPTKYNNEYIFDPSRDRTSLTDDNLAAIAFWLSYEGMTPGCRNNEIINLIHTLEPYWEVDITNKYKEKSSMETFADKIIKYGTSLLQHDCIFEFPNKSLIADSYKVSDQLKRKYLKEGYKICNDDLAKIGMSTIEDLVLESRKHKAIAPTEQEKNKILLIQEALKILTPALKANGLFTDEELKPTILLFNNKGKEENDTYKNVLAEAIVNHGESQGFWIDKEYLKKDFSSVLTTALHELTHKYGGDETSVFSYKLTDVMETVEKAQITDKNVTKELQILNETWKKI